MSWYRDDYDDIVEKLWRKCQSFLRLINSFFDSYCLLGKQGTLSALIFREVHCIVHRNSAITIIGY